MRFPKKCYISSIRDGLGYVSNDDKYLGPHKNKVCNLVDYYKDSSSMFLTDIYVREHRELRNDYIYNGWVIVSSENVTLLEE